MASVDPITPSTPVIAITTTSVSPIESITTPSISDLPPLSPTNQPTIMDASTIPSEGSLTPPQQQPLQLPTEVPLSEVAIKSEASIIATPLKRPRHKPEERKELLEKAVRDVKEQKISMRKAASRYNIAKSSLCDYVRKNNIILPNNRCKPSATTATGISASANNSNGEDYHNQHPPLYFDAAMAEALQTSAALQLPITSAQSRSFNFPLETANLLRAAHAGTPPGVNGGFGSVFSRLESPWNNVSGLPTQAPMQNWSSHGRPVSSLSRASAASSPKPAEPLLGFNMESNLPDGACNNDIKFLQPHQHSQLPSADVFTATSSASSFVCASLPNDVLKSIPPTTPFFASSTATSSPTLAPTTRFASSLPHPLTPPPSLQMPTGITGEALTPTSIYAQTPPLPPSQQPLPLSSAPQLPLIFPPSLATDIPNSADASMIIDSLQRLLLAATATASRTDGKHLLPANLGDLLFNLPSPISFPTPAAITNTTIASALLRKLQLPSCATVLSPNAAPNCSSNSAAEATAAAAAVIARLPQTQMAYALELINFINKSPSPFHVVRSVSEILTSHGFRELSENEPWKLAPNDRVFVTKNSTSVFAFAVGGAYKPGEGFGIIGAHTDSPCLRLKPLSERVNEGFVQLAVQTYGEGLWHTWFDRDLTLAGRCVVRNSTTNTLEERLVHFDQPLACVPSLAIHLDANKNFAPNSEVHLAPILCTALTEKLNAPEDTPGPSGHPAGLLRLLAKELQCAPSDLVELELYLADTQPATIGGLHKEFIHAPRLDNQFSAYASVRALINSLANLKDEPFVRVVCLYDHEEIGSCSFQGANSVYTECLFRRVTEALAVSAVETADSASVNGGVADLGSCTGAGAVGVERCLFERTMARSFFLSADQAHAVHPSWSGKHEPAHKPGFHRGMVLKHHCSQNYATNGLTSAVVKGVARRTDVPIQEYVARQDQWSGCTIGPIVASHLGVMTADIGGAQLAMHSCREITCTSSVSHAVTLFTGFFEYLSDVLSSIVPIK